MVKMKYELSFDVGFFYPKSGVYFNYSKDALCFSDFATLRVYSIWQELQAGPAPRDIDRVTKLWFIPDTRFPQVW